MLALLALQPPGFGAFAEPAPGVPPRGAGELLEARAGGGEKTVYSTDSSDTCRDYGAWKGHEEYSPGAASSPSAVEIRTPAAPGAAPLKLDRA